MQSQRYNSKLLILLSDALDLLHKLSLILQPDKPLAHKQLSVEATLLLLQRPPLQKRKKLLRQYLQPPQHLQTVPFATGPFEEQQQAEYQLPRARQCIFSKMTRFDSRVVNVLPSYSLRKRTKVIDKNMSI